jgi:hypothetical protein
MSEKISFAGDEAQYIAPSWDQLDSLTHKTAKQVLESGENYDLIVALAKGAWPMSRSFIDFLGKTDLASLGIKFYSGINERLKEPKVYQDLPAEVKADIKGKKVLLFDDVADTGESLRFAIDYLLECGAAEVKTATIYMKARTVVVPDYYGAETDAWIIFPFEVREMMELLNKTWVESGISREEIRERFSAFNFNEEMIDYFFDKI